MAGARARGLAHPAARRPSAIASRPPGSGEPVIELARGLVITLASLSALSALAGGVGLIGGKAGGPYLPPLRLLAHTPFGSFLLPGLLLASVVGGSSLACAILVWRRSRAAVDATVLAGGALTVWIVAELAMLREFHWLHAIYGMLGVAMLGLGASTAWRSNVPRHRWMLTVTIAEALGFFVPAGAGILSTQAGLGEVPRAALLVAAGLVEGMALGAGQAWAFPLPVRRWRYALLSALGAGVVWAAAMAMTLLIGAEALAPALVSLAAVPVALIALAAIGSAQWIELRHHTPAARRWVPWTALAWTMALPLSFTPAPFVDASTPLASLLALWGCGGLLMASVMALITWQAARRMLPRSAAPAIPTPGSAAP